MFWPGYFPHSLSEDLAGKACTAAGYTCAAWLDAISSQPNVAWLKWTRINTDVHSIRTRFLIHFRGEWLRTEESTKAVIGAQRTESSLRTGLPYEFDILSRSQVQASFITDSNLLWRPERGNRVKLTWTEISRTTNPDFAAYLLYWDNEREDGNVDTLLATIYGADNTSFTTGELADGTHSFKLAFRDEIGNVSTLGTVVTGVIDTYPVAVDDAALEYTQGTRKVTLTADEPAGQAGDVKGYAIYYNNLPGYGLQNALCLERWLRVADTPQDLEQMDGGSMSWTSEELFAGSWRFCIRAVDKAGGESDFTELVVVLAMSGGNLVEAPAQPDAPYFIDAEANSAGTITVTTRHAGTDATHIRFYQDGVQVDETAIVAGTTDYTYTTGGLVHDQEYDFTSRAVNTVGGITTLSELSDTVSETADDTAPTGTKTLTTEITF